MLLEVAAVTVLLAMAAGAALWWCYAQGYLLYFGDAVSHVNTARRIVDSRTPGIDQLGSPWLPLPHVLMLPFVGDDHLWRTGLAGGIPSSLCFVAAGVMLYAAVRLALDSRTAGATAAAIFAMNPNLLYIQSTPMTETVFFAAVLALLVSSMWAAGSQSVTAVLVTALLSNLACMTRYEAWILVPFVAVYLLMRRGVWHAVLFVAIAAIAPLAWFGYNAYYSGNALEFYNGPYSAKAIYERALKSGMARYAGDHEWGKAVLYYGAAARLCSGTALAVIGMLGLVAAVLKRALWPLLFLLLPCAFFVLSIYSSGTPIFVPELWPNSYYNTRYGLSAIPLLALGCAALVAFAPDRFRLASAVALVACCVTPWLLYPRPDAWIVWKESQVNSEARRAWTRTAAGFLRTKYVRGQGIVTSFGDLTGIFQTAGIPIRETLYDGNNPAWLAAVTRPDFFLHEEWAVAQAGDSVATAVQRVNRKRTRYRLVESIMVKGAPVIEIYKRN
jgi:hypothetical protein